MRFSTGAGTNQCVTDKYAERFLLPAISEQLSEWSGPTNYGSGESHFTTNSDYDAIYSELDHIAADQFPARTYSIELAFKHENGIVTYDQVFKEDPQIPALRFYSCHTTLELQ